MQIIEKRKVITSIFFVIGTLTKAVSIYLIESSYYKAGAITALLGLYALISGIYLHGWLELNAMADLRDFVDNEADRP